MNDLPLTLVLSWYEQKAVCILLTLLSRHQKYLYRTEHSGLLLKDVLDMLVEKFDLHPITTPEEDLKAILKA